MRPTSGPDPGLVRTSCVRSSALVAVPSKSHGLIVVLISRSSTSFVFVWVVACHARLLTPGAVRLTRRPQLNLDSLSPQPRLLQLLLGAPRLLLLCMRCMLRTKRARSPCINRWRRLCHQPSPVSKDAGAAAPIPPPPGLRLWSSLSRRLC